MKTPIFNLKTSILTLFLTIVAILTLFNMNTKPIQSKEHLSMTAITKNIVINSNSRSTNMQKALIDFYPADTNNAIIILHGGGWHGGDKYEMNYFSKGFNALGYNVINLGYRLSPGNIYPDQLEDIEASIKWLNQQIPDIQHIHLFGFSAGGHLSLLYAYKNPNNIASVTSIAGPIDLSKENSCMNCGDIIPVFLGSTVAEKASPYHCLNKKSPKTLLFHAQDDDIVHSEQSTALIKKAETLGLSPENFQLEAISTGGHLFLYGKAGADYILQKTDAFIKTP